MTPRSAGSVSADLPFVCRIEDADASQPGLFGGKGAGLARMTAAGLPVPPGESSPPKRVVAMAAVSDGPVKDGRRRAEER